MLAFSVFSAEDLVVVLLAGAELTLELLVELLDVALLVRAGAVLVTADLLVVLRAFSVAALCVFTLLLLL